MSGAHRNRACPCGSSRKYKRCCLPIHDGREAQSPEVLMRSRYCAYALGESEYIIKTTYPDSPHYERDLTSWRTDLDQYCRTTEFEGLEVLACRTERDEGWVRFRASLTQGETDLSFVEHSHFLRVEGRWLYHSALNEEA